MERCSQCSERSDDHETQADKKEHQRTHRRRKFYQPQVLRGVFAVKFLKFFDLCRFLRVGANHADARKIFLRARRDARKIFLNLLETNVNLFA